MGLFLDERLARLKAERQRHAIRPQVVICDTCIERVGALLGSLRTVFDVLYCATLEEAEGLCRSEERCPAAVVTPLQPCGNGKMSTPSVFSPDVGTFLEVCGSRVAIVVYGRPEAISPAQQREAFLKGAVNFVNEASHQFPAELRDTLLDEITHWYDRGVCHGVRRYCSPEIVYSAEAQENFRDALRHFASCLRAVCTVVQEKVSEVTQKKLLRMWERGTRLGCPLVTGELYGKDAVTFSLERFRPVATHLADCADPSCAKLRRALLLTIRDSLSHEMPIEKHWWGHK